MPAPRTPKTRRKARRERPGGAAPTAGEGAAGFVAVGRVRAPRGLSGELNVEPLTDFPDRFAPGETVWVGGRRLVVEGARRHQKDLLLKLEGIDSPEDGAGLRGR